MLNEYDMQILNYVGIGDSPPPTSNYGDIFVTNNGKAYVYTNHSWEEMGTVSPAVCENEDEEYITQEIVYIK